MATVINVQADFYKWLAEDQLQERSLVIDFNVLMDSNIVKWHFRRIKNITFKEPVSIINIDYDLAFEFVNCSFEKGIVFKNTRFTAPQTGKDFSILFFNCKGIRIALVDNCHFAMEVIIDRCPELDGVFVGNTTILNGGFRVSKSTVDILDISQGEFDLKIRDSILNKQLRVDSLNGNVSLINSAFNEWVKFWNIECINSFVLNKNKFENTFDIEGSRINGIFIHGDEFARKATLENRDATGANKTANLNEIYITEAKFVEGFDFNGLGKTIQKITLPITPLLEGLLRFEGWKVDSTNISGVNQNLKLLFKRVSFRFLVFHGFTNYSDISLDKCDGYGDSTLNLIDSDMGSARFNEFSFDSFTAIRSDNVSLDAIKLTNVKWFKDKSLMIEVDQQSHAEQFRRRREVYRQLKQALKNNGNQIDSLIFQARELEALKNEYKHSEEKNFGDKVIMIINRSNNFGLDWVKPAVILIVVTFTTYGLLLPALSQVSYEVSWTRQNFQNTVSEFSTHSNILWKLFNPIRQYTVTYGDVDIGWIYFVDLLHRIFLGIMIFQIIKAFRKYVTS